MAVQSNVPLKFRYFPGNNSKNDNPECSYSSYDAVKTRFLQKSAQQETTESEICQRILCLVNPFLFPFTRRRRVCLRLELAQKRVSRMHQPVKSSAELEFIHLCPPHRRSYLRVITYALAVPSILDRARSRLIFLLFPLLVGQGVGTTRFRSVGTKL